MEANNVYLKWDIHMNLTYKKAFARIVRKFHKQAYNFDFSSKNMVL